MFFNWLHPFPKIFFLWTAASKSWLPIQLQSLSHRAFHRIKKRVVPTNSLNINCDVTLCERWRFMSGLDCCPFLIITVLHLLPTERGSSSIWGCCRLTSISRQCWEISQDEGGNNGVCMPVSHTSINTEKCKWRGQCSGVFPKHSDLLPHKTCKGMEGALQE